MKTELIDGRIEVVSQISEDTVRKTYYTKNESGDYVAGESDPLDLTDVTWLTDEDKAAEAAQQLVDTESAWVKAELENSDVEVRKHEDSAPRAKGADVQVWRTYRNELRNYIQGGVISTDKPVRPV